MNPFDQLVNDIFSNPDVTNYCYINDKKITCTVSNVIDKPVYTEYGEDEGVSFTLTIKLSQYKAKKNDVVIFNDVSYIVDSTSIDSANLTQKLFLQSTSTK